MKSKQFKITTFRFLILFLSVFLLVAYTLWPDIPKRSEPAREKLSELTLSTFKEDGKWGYMIVQRGKIIIRQDVIPAVPGNQYFSSKSQAEKVGSLTLQKIRNGEAPSINIRELDSLNITYQVK